MESSHLGDEPSDILSCGSFVGGHASCRDNGEKWLVLLGADAINLVGDTLGDQVHICWLERYWRFDDGGVE